MKKSKRLDPLIEKAIKTSFKEGKLLEVQVNIHSHITQEHVLINPNILGGVKIRLADTVYDLSLKGKLQQVKEAISGQ